MLGVLAVPLFADNTVCGSVIHDQGPDASGNGYKVSYIRVKIGKKEAHAVGVARVELPINVLIQ